jgi:predicted dinucleotide-binding enzyme
MSDTVIAIIGAGRVGGSLGVHWAQAGYRVVYGTRNPGGPAILDVLKRTGNGSTAVSIAEATAAADIVLLSVPWSAAKDTLNAMQPLSGKIIIDSTNLFAFVDGQHLEVDTPRSGGELIQEWAAGAQVVKGFNTLNWRVMDDPKIAGGPVTIPLASDTPEATARVAALVSAIGFEPFDTGPLHQSRHLEHMAFLYINMLMQPRADTFEFHLRPRKK